MTTVATPADIQLVIDQCKATLASRKDHAKSLRENLRLLHAHMRTQVQGDGAAYRREIATALAEMRTDVKDLKDELKLQEAMADELELDLIQSLTLTNEKHVSYTDLGTLSISSRGYWKIEDDANPQIKAENERKFFEFLEQEVRVKALTMADAMNLRQNRFSAASLEETMALYEAQGVVLPGVKKVVKQTISFRKA